MNGGLTAGTRAGVRRRQAIAYALVAIAVCAFVTWRSAAPTLGWRLEAGVLSAGCVLALWWLLGYVLRSDVAGGVALVALVAVLGVASRIKEGILGEPLFPWDLLSLRQAWSIGPHYASPVAIGGAFVAIVVIAAVAWWFRRGARPHGAYVVAGLALLAVVASTSVPQSPPFPARNVIWDVRGNIAANGPLLAFVINVQALLLKPPAVSTADANALLDAAHGPAPVSGAHPDVVVILVEAWMDVDNLGSGIDACLKPRVRHAFQSPRFGGLTPNVEFEVMTGYPDAFVPEFSVPYQMYVKRPVEHALPQVFRAAGYSTFAAHNYPRSFWNRANVMPWLGFRRYVGIEDMPPRPNKGAFPDDAMLFAALEAELARAQDGPKLVYGLTMGTHGLYDGEARYPRHEPAPASIGGKLDAAQQLAVGNYLAVAGDVERELCGFLDRMRERSNETLVFVFGDHWPTFGRDLTVYRELGIASKPDIYALPYGESLRMHRTPLIAWSNRRGDLALTQPVVPAFGLGSEILRAAGLPVEGVWALELANAGKAASIACCWQDAQGRPHDFRDDPVYAALYRDAYDRVLVPREP